MEIRNRYNHKTLKGDKESPKGISLTIPGETYTIRELLIKHTQGVLPPGIDRQPHYAEDTDFNSPDYHKINNLDIVDKNTYNNNKQI